MQKFIADAAEFIPILFQGVVLTIGLTIGSLIISTLLGLVWALMRVSGVWALNGTAKLFVNFIRGIPIIVQLFYIYFVLPDLGITLSAMQAAIIGLGIAYSAYHSENFRAGIEAIDHGQIEAAQSIGMGWWMVMRRVILPQAIRRMIPPFVNQSITQLKNTSLVSTIAVPDLLYNGTLITADTYRPLEVYTVVAVIYFALLFPSTLLAQAYERRLAARPR